MDNQPIIPTHPLPEQQTSSNLAWLKTLSYGFSLVSFGIAIGIGGYILTTKNQLTPSPAEVSTKAGPTIDPTASWKTYSITPDSSLGYARYQIKLPIDWKQIEHSSNFQGTEMFQDSQSLYKLVIKEEKNYNDQTRKPFTNFRELTGLSYDVNTVIVDEQQAAQSLPRAGSEYIYKILFFSKDTKLVYNITLETPHDGSKIPEGKVLFDQILSTFRFD